MIKRRWTQEEIEIIREKYPYVGAAGLTEILHRSQYQLRWKAGTLGIKVLRYQQMKIISGDELVELYIRRQLSASEIAKLYDVTDSAIYARLNRFGIRRRSNTDAMNLYFTKHPPAVGEQSSSWRGGKTHHQGYVYVHIYPDNPFYCMAQKGGWVAEHRLVMAQYLGRPLEKWEIVHHKNGPKDDNKIGNLELHPTQASHVTYTMFKRELHNRDKEIRLLKWQIKTLKQQLIEAGVLGANAGD